MFLLDTDTLSQVLKPDPSLSLLRRPAEVPPEQQFTTAITVGKLVYGAHRGPRLVYHLRQLDEGIWP